MAGFTFLQLVSNRFKATWHWYKFEYRENSSFGGKLVVEDEELVLVVLSLLCIFGQLKLLLFFDSDSDFAKMRFEKSAQYL
jgi:hypothetical protein